MIDIINIWGMYVILGMMVIYTITAFYRKKLAQEIGRGNLKRIFLTIWFLITTVAVNFSSEYSIKVCGKNPLGLGEPIWVIILWILAGLLLYYVFICNMRFKSLNLKGVATELEDDESTEALMEIDKKTEAFYYTYEDVFNLAKDLRRRIRNENSAPIDYLIELKKVVDAYAVKSSYYYNCFIRTENDFDEEGFTDPKAIIGKLKYQQCDTQIRNNQKYLLIPFFSATKTMFVVGMASDNKAVGIEHYLIIGLLKSFEELILASNEE